MGSQDVKLVMQFYKREDLVLAVPSVVWADVTVALEINNETLTVTLNKELIEPLFNSLKLSGIEDDNISIDINGVPYDLDLNSLTASKRIQIFTRQPVYFEANQLEKPKTKIRVLGYPLILDRVINSEDTMSELERKVNSVLEYLRSTQQKINPGSPEVYVIDSDYARDNADRLISLFRIIRPTNIGVVVRATPLSKHTKLHHEFMTDSNTLK